MPEWHVTGLPVFGNVILHFFSVWFYGIICLRMNGAWQGAGEK